MGSTTKLKLGDRLIKAGVITQPQLNLALLEQGRHGGLLGDILERLGFSTQEAIAVALAAETSSTIINLQSLDILPEILQLVPVNLALKFKAVPISLENRILTIAMADTFNAPAVDELERITNYRIKVVAASAKEILEAIDERYSSVESFEDLIDSALRTVVENEPYEAGKQAPLVRLVDRIIIASIRKKTTDIHIEPEENSLLVRFRIDGFLYHEHLLPMALLPAINARLKIMANLNVTEHRLPQDGRISLFTAGKKIDLRVSTLPTQYGESIVMRVLDGTNSLINLQSLGLEGNDLKNIEEAITKPYGIILVTGPTGSGKTTTLYAALNQMDALNQSIFTLEDPIEYSLPLVRQVQIQPEIGLTFSSGLRALLRQDPDVMLVGEIRDDETAELAIRSALTGHLVLSTLHTNTAIGAIPRLINMGIEPYLLASALRMVIGQRLVRRVCSDCKVIDPEGKEKIVNLHFDIPDNTVFYKGEGCPSCYNTGYSGRIAIYETIDISKEMKEILVPGVQESDLIKVAEKQGSKFLVNDGLQKAINGIVSVEDVLRIIG